MFIPHFQYIKNKNRRNLIGCHKSGRINPARLTASGRSEYIPVDAANTSEARQKNRRTEIVLTPDLTELYRLINQY